MKEKKDKLKYRIPKEIGAAIDLLFAVRVARKKIQADAEAEKRQEDMIEESILQTYNKSKLEGATGKRAQASIGRKDYPNVKDQKKFDAFILKNKRLDLLQRRPAVEAIREMWKDGKTVPGIETFTKVSLSLTKR